MSEKTRSQTRLLIQRNFQVFKGDNIQLFISIIVPVILSVLLYYICDNFEIYEEMEAAVFICSIAPFFVGVFNSLTVVGKERKVIKRENLSFLSIRKYIISQVVFQSFVVLLQSYLFTTVYHSFMHMFEMDKFIYVFINIFLTMMAGDTLGLLISSIFKKQETANLIAPVVIIVELVLCGVLFDFGDIRILDILSCFMATRWGVSGLGSILDITSLPHTIEYYEGGLVAQAFPMLTELTDFDKQAYVHTSQNILKCWIILVALSVLSVVLAIVFLNRVKYDNRD